MKLTSHILPILAALAAFAAYGSRTSAPKPVDAWLEQSPDGPAGQLCVVDSLMWQQPDSALTLLLDFAAGPRVDSLDVFNGHYFQLLVSELLYKNYYEQTNRPDLLRAVGYFDSIVDLHGADAHGVSVWPFQRSDASNASANTTAFLAARAHYINGVGYYERDSVVEACAEYIRALEVMDGHFEESGIVGKKAQFMALNYTHLFEVFSDQYFHEQAIHFGKESLVYYGKYDATAWHKAWILNEIGSHYDMMDDFDSAVYYYDKCRVVLSDTTRQTYRDVSARQAFLSYRMGGDFQVSINQLRGLIAQAEHPNELPSRLALIGEIYYKEKEYDSAMYYMKKVFKESPSIEFQKQAAERLVELCEALGREDEIMEYAAFCVPFATQNESNSLMKSQLAELYKKELRQKDRLLPTKRTKWSYYFVIGLLVAIAGVFILSRKYKRKIGSLEIQFKEEKYAHEIQQAALAGRLRKSNEALRVQKKESSALVRELNIQQGRKEWNRLEVFMNEKICTDIVGALGGKQIKREAKSSDYSELRLSDANLNSLCNAIEKHFCGFEKTLTELYPKISRKEMHQCMLYLLNLEDVQIAALLSCDYSTVKRRSAKLKQAFGIEKEARQFIRELVL